MEKIRMPAALVLPILLAGLVSCQPLTVKPETVGLSSEKLAAVSASLQELVDQKKLAGGVILIARHGKIAHLDWVGMQDVENRVPMSPLTMFRICSMTKPITSVGIMILVEEGMLGLLDPVSMYLPEFKEMKVAVSRGEGGGKTREIVPARQEITILDLLVHLSGLTYRFWDRPYFSELYERAGVSDGLVETEGTMGDNVKRLAALPLMFQPASDWEYGLSTDVLGHVIEVVTGQTLEEFFQERIFGPLDMKDTCFHVPRSQRSRVAAVYRPREDKTIERLPGGPVRTGGAVYSASYPFQEGKFFSGGAGLVSTVQDYFRFLQMLLNGGELDGARILKEEVVQEMVRDQTGKIEIKIKSHGDGFGLGFGVVTGAARDQGLGSVGTYSWGGFYHTYFWVDPEEELIGICMSQLYPWDHLNLWTEIRKRTYEAILK